MFEAQPLLGISNSHVSYFLYTHVKLLAFHREVSAMVRLLAISGSLREGSSNARLLAAAQWVRLDGLTIKTYCGLDQLPRFNPDLLQSPPEPVLALYALIADTDGLLISCPEYARGMPGSFKNMLDWLVSSETFQECRLRCSMPRLGLPAPKLCCG